MKPPQEIINRYWVEAVNGEQFLVHKQTADIFSLNAMGEVFFDLVKSGMDESEIIVAVSQQLTTPPEQVKHDFNNLLESLSNPAQAEEVIENNLNCFDISDFSPLPQQLPEHTEHYLLNSRLFKVNFHNARSYALIHGQLCTMQVSANKKTNHPTFVIDLKMGQQGVGVYLNDVIQVATHDTDWLDVHVKQLLVDNACQQLPCWINIHAAAILNQQNQAIVFAAPSGSGKSTLITSLALKGYRYLGDDTLMLDLKTQRIIPFPAAANLKPGSWPLFEHHIPELANLPIQREYLRSVKFTPLPIDPAVLENTYPVKALLFPTYNSEGAATIESISTSELFRLLSAAKMYINPAVAQKVSQEFIAFGCNTPAFTLQYGSTNQAIALLKQQSIL